jgi:helix-turn-helix protein
MTTTATRRRRRTLASPAAYALAQAGVTQTDLAEVLGVTQTSASLYLRGLRRAPGRLRSALVGLIGSEAADAVLAAIPPDQSELGPNQIAPVQPPTFKPPTPRPKVLYTGPPAPGRRYVITNLGTWQQRVYDSHGRLIEVRQRERPAQPADQPQRFPTLNVRPKGGQS